MHMYRRIAKTEILRAAQEGREWKTIASTHGIPYQTAWCWVDQARKTDLWDIQPPRNWGGPRDASTKVTQEIADYLESRLSENCRLTLAEMADAVESAQGVQLSVRTVKRTIYDLAFTLKALHRQPATTNTEANREQRRDYLVQLLAYQSEGKSVYYVDETNFNIWCSRGVG